MKQITITSSNGATFPTTAADNATVKDVLASVEVQTFFGHSAQEIQNAFSSKNGFEIAAGLRPAMLTSVVDNNDILGVALATSNMSVQAASATVVPGTVNVNYQGGLKSRTLTGIAIGTTSVKDCIMNPVIQRQFNLEGVGMSTLEVMLNMEELTTAQLSTVKVKDGDRIDIQTRQEKTQGADTAEFYDVKAKAKIKAAVIAKVQFANGRYALKAKTADGRGLYRFVTKAVFDKSTAPVAKATK